MTLPKLNLRDLFWLVAVVALALGWWLDRRQLDLELRGMRGQLDTAGFRE